jgi:lysozyme family protein
MKESIDKAMSFMFSWEGGYSNDLDDAGGETNFGISKRAYPNEDIKNMTKERATELYVRDYWNACNCGELPYPLDIVCFDTAVNMGVGRSQAFLDSTRDWKDYLMLRIERYIALGKKNPQYIRGWINRVISLWKSVK